MSPKIKKFAVTTCLVAGVAIVSAGAMATTAVAYGHHRHHRGYSAHYKTSHHRYHRRRRGYTHRAKSYQGPVVSIKKMMEYAMSQLVSEGVKSDRSREAASHLVGQAYVESRLNPHAVHDGGVGYGIYGANGARLKNMRAWLGSHGYAQSSHEGQMRYMAHEAMSGRYPRTKAALLNASVHNLASNVNVVTAEFESPRYVNNRYGAVKMAYQSAGDLVVSASAGSLVVNASVGNSASKAQPIARHAVLRKRTRARWRWRRHYHRRHLYRAWY